MSRSLVVVTAGLSQPSSTRMLADQLAEATASAVGARGESVEVQVIELRDLAADLATTMTTGGMPPPAVARARDLLAAADGVIAVTPVFSASYSGLFKMFFDVLDTDTLTGVPVVIAATAGTPRHSLVLDHALRPLLGYLRAVVVPTGVFAATEDFGGGEGGRALSARVARAAQELAGLMVADAAGVQGFTRTGADLAPRTRASGNSPDADVTPFEQLLRGHAG